MSDFECLPIGTAERLKKLEAEVERLRADAERLDFIEANPNMSLRHHRKRWAFVGLTSYEYDMHTTLREAIDAAIKEGQR